MLLHYHRVTLRFAPCALCLQGRHSALFTQSTCLSFVTKVKGRKI